ncbi:PqqD family peptide modification chaperone [Mucilaginibacter sp. HMF5004]|uniref:PqqD family peptide modification chaperone n=1 Tax=Mucilaginibacter rivuli TaxID=2857527 RepID=UPI001C5CC70D|nr:PqqD family peptide modification chaperone [Mucilaginibacter rivuli]MBW4890007.1 PqqD family peptide modification chaperone [Mucilaginibacter rivuli]
MITLDTTIQRNTDNLLTSEVGDELVMMDMDGGNYISLNKTGRVIWEQIEQPVKVGDMVNRLTTRFDIDKETCAADTLEYLENMLAQKVITVA